MFQRTMFPALDLNLVEASIGLTTEVKATEDLYQKHQIETKLGTGKTHYVVITLFEQHTHLAMHPNPMVCNFNLLS